MTRPLISASAIESIHDESTELLVESLCYCAFKLRTEIASLEEVDRLKVQGEAFRLTFRLAWMSGWLQIQRAGMSEETSTSPQWSEITREWENVLAQSMDPPEIWIPSRLQLLLARSRNLLLHVRQFSRTPDNAVRLNS